MKLIIDYPWYFVLLCLLLGIAYAFVLYYRVRRDDDGMSRQMILFLSALRTLAVAAIAFLLLSPLVKRQTNHKEKPVIITLEDNSESLNMTPDSAYYNNEFQQEMDALAEELGNDFDVHRYHYGSSIKDIKPTDGADAEGLFSDSYTDISAAIDEIAERYYRRNVGAIILTGDGIFNHGINPMAAATKAAIPVYTVAMGDTTHYPDAAIANLRYNHIAYVGNDFPIDITINASLLAGKEATLSVSRDGQKLFSKKIIYDNQRFSTTESIMLEADKEGLHNYLIEITPLNGEKTIRNNRRTIPVEIIDGRKRVAIIAAVPHPDIAALRAAIESNRNYEVETFLASDFNAHTEDYDMLILHQLPTKVAQSNIDIAALLKGGIPTLFVIGSQTDLPRFNALHTGLEIFTRIERQNETFPLKNSNFTFFTLDDNVSTRIASFPPLLSPFGEYRLAGNAQALFTSRIGSVNSGQPLIAMTQVLNRRYAFIAGEGLWRWRMADYLSNSTHDDFDQLMSKIIVFTSIHAGNDRFHVDVPHLVAPTDAIVAEAQLYNENYEAVNTPDVQLTLQDDSGKKYQHLFNRSGTGYSVNIGTLPPATYRYTATTKLSGAEFSASGSFIVDEHNLEAMLTIADHSLMNTIATSTGAVMVDAHHCHDLADIIRQRDDMHTLIYSETTYSDMLNSPLLLLLVLALLAAEWIIRKYNGTV